MPPGDGQRRDPALARGRGPLHADVHEGRGGPHRVRAREAELADQSRPLRMARVLLRRNDLVRRLAGQPRGEDDGPRSEQGERLAPRRLFGAGRVGRRSAGDALRRGRPGPGGRRPRSWPAASSGSAAISPTSSASRPTSFKTCWPASSSNHSAARAFWPPGPCRSRITRRNPSASAACPVLVDASRPLQDQQPGHEAPRRAASRIPHRRPRRPPLCA